MLPRINNDFRTLRLGKKAHAAQRAIAFGGVSYSDLLPVDPASQTPRRMIRLIDALREGL